MNLEPVIGLEVHVQLKTESKLFCRCSTAFGAEPNSHICPICCGHPGALPYLNRKAVELVVRAGLGVGYMPEDRGLVPELTVEENILVPVWVSKTLKVDERLRFVDATGGGKRIIEP